MEPQLGAGQGDLKAGGGSRVAEDLIAQAKGQIIHRPGWRHAHMPVTDAARIILHGRLQAGL